MPKKLKTKPVKVTIKTMKPKRRLRANPPRARRNGPSAIGKTLRTVGSVAGGFLGSSTAGRAIGAGISRIFGQGAYTVKQNSLMSGPPSFSPLGSGIRISHREYLGDLLSSIGFNNTTYRLQPSDSRAFPWLSQLAKNFEQYKFNGIVYYLNTTSGNAISGTNNTLGVWGITTVYDPSLPAFSTKQQAEDYMGCTASIPSCSVLHPVECKPKSDVLERYYVDQSLTITGQDLKFYDHGVVNIFTSGQQAASVNLGEIWVSYDITFYNPKIVPVAGNPLGDHFYASGTTVTATNPMGTVAINASTGSNLGTSLSFPAGGRFTINIPASIAPCTLLVVYAYKSGTNTATSVTLGTTGQTGNIINSLILSGGANNAYFQTGSATLVGDCFQMQVFRKTDNGSGVINMGGTNVIPVSSATSTADLFIIPLPFSIGDAPLDHQKDLLFEMFREFYRRSIKTDDLWKFAEESKDTDSIDRII